MNPIWAPEKHSVSTARTFTTGAVALAQAEAGGVTWIR